MDFTNISVMVAIVMGLAEVAKKVGINAKIIPILNLVLGIVVGIVYSGLEIKEGVATGIIVGLTASGVYSGTKNTIENFK